MKFIINSRNFLKLSSIHRIQATNGFSRSCCTPESNHTTRKEMHDNMFQAVKLAMERNYCTKSPFSYYFCTNSYANNKIKQNRIIVLPQKLNYASSRNLQYKADQLLPRLLEGNRVALSKSITLVESKNIKHHQEAEKLLSELPTKDKSIRIGISGPPGVGKSSFIETFGAFIISMGLKVAVLAVDPSSTRTGGSILGDKTRMETLSRDPNAYIRPSPSAGFLGGVTANAFESIAVCEAAGYDVIIVETVGVGQSETQVADLCDMVMLLVNPGGGDALQGIKRGIVEIADLIVVTKADGDLLSAARKTRTEYLNALRLVQGHALEGHRICQTEVLLCSSLEHNITIEKVWEAIMQFQSSMSEAGKWQEKRLEQRRKWVWRHVTETVWTKLYHHPGSEEFLTSLQNRIDKGEIQPRVAVGEILRFFFETYKEELESED